MIESFNGPAGPVSERVHFRLRELKDWRVLRQATLQALAESPDAFQKDLAQEEGVTEADWRARIKSSTWVVAMSGRQAIGVARLAADQNPEAEVKWHVGSVWVAESQRKRGLLRDMLEWVDERARAEGATELLLWVFKDNEAARKAYIQLGFHETGETQTMDTWRGSVEEYRMCRPIQVRTSCGEGLGAQPLRECEIVDGFPNARNSTKPL